MKEGENNTIILDNVHCVVISIVCLIYDKKYIFFNIYLLLLVTSNYSNCTIMYIIVINEIPYGIQHTNTHNHGLEKLSKAS